MFRVIIAFAFSIVALTSNVKAQQQPFPGEIVGAWCSANFGNLSASIIRPGANQFIPGGEPQAITLWEEHGNIYYIGIADYRTFGQGAANRIEVVSDSSIRLSINFFNPQDYAKPPSERRYFDPTTMTACTEQQLTQLNFSTAQANDLLSNLKETRQALLAGEPLPGAQQQGSAGSAASGSAVAGNGISPDERESALSARLREGMNGWVNDTWRILKSGEHGWTRWNGPVLKMNFPEHYCFQNNQAPYECYYRVVTQKTAASLSCNPRGGHCQGVMTLRDGIRSKWSMYEVGTAWHDGKLALTFINPSDDRPGTQNSIAQWGEYCTQRVMFGNPVGVPLPECFYGGTIEEGKEALVQGCGQTGCPYITWVALAISPDSKNRHHGGAHVAASNTPVGAYGAAMQYCEIFSTTGNCFVVEVIPTQPGNSAVSSSRANGDPNWP